MGYIKKLKNNELVGGTDKTTIYPVTSTEAVFEEVIEDGESNFKSQKTINKEQQNTLDAHNGRVTYLEDHAVKSVTINGGTKTYTVDDTGNVNLDVYTTESAEGQATLAEEVGDIRSIVGTKDSPASDTLVNRVGELETLVGGSGQGSVNTRIANAKAEILGDAAEDYNTLGKVEDKIQEEVARATAEETELSIYVHAIEGGNIRVKSSTPINPDTGAPANTVYRVAGTTTYSDYMWNGTTMVKMAEYNVDTLESQFGYYKWETASNTISITTSNQVAGSPIGSYVLTAGGSFKIKMTNKATGACTLNMNGTGAKTLLYNGDPVASNNTWENNEVISVYYDGTNYQASNSQGGSNRKIDAYLYGDLRTLAIGQTYEENEAVKTTDKQLFRMTKEIKAMNLFSEIAADDLKTYGSGANANTYQAQKSISLYDGTKNPYYAEGDYAIGRPATATIAFTADSATIEALTEAVPITVTIVGNACTVDVTSASDATSVATAVKNAFDALSVEGWELLDDENGTLTLNSLSGMSSAPAITSSVEESGITVTPISAAGSTRLSQYISSAWSDVTLADYAADAVAVGETDATKMWKTLSVEDIVNNYATQNYAPKLYDKVGQNTDGAMTQKAITDIVQIDEEPVQLAFSTTVKYYWKVVNGVVTNTSTSSSEYHRATAIDISGYSKIKAKFALTGALSAVTCFGDKNANLVGNAVSVNDGEIILEVPENAKYFYLTNRGSGTAYAYGIVSKNTKERFIEQTELNKDYSEHISTHGAYDVAGNTFAITDGHGNILFELKKGHIKTKKFSSEQKLKILVFGNSYSLDSFSYLPFILKNYGIDVCVGIYHRQSGTIAELVSGWTTASYYFYYIDTETSSAWTYVGDYTPKACAEFKDWDIITLQQQSDASHSFDTYEPAVRSLIDLIYSAVSNPIQLAWNININNKNHSNINQILTNIENCVAQEPINLIFPYGTAIFNARTNETLDAIGSGGHLWYSDQLHLQEGLPCYIAALANVQAIFNKFYPKYTVANEKIGATITQEMINGWSVKGQHGTCTGISEENCRLAQKCAILANKKPFEVTTIY